MWLVCYPVGRAGVIFAPGCPLARWSGTLVPSSAGPLFLLFKFFLFIFEIFGGRLSQSGHFRGELPLFAPVAGCIDSSNLRGWAGATRVPLALFVFVLRHAFLLGG